MNHVLIPQIVISHTGCSIKNWNGPPHKCKK